MIKDQFGYPLLEKTNDPLVRSLNHPRRNLDDPDDNEELAERLYRLRTFHKNYFEELFLRAEAMTLASYIDLIPEMIIPKTYLSGRTK